MTPLSSPARYARFLTWAAMAYWGCAALIFPVMIWDAHTYNLARVEIARLGGLFDNPYWLGERQVVFPWAFDALHLPPILLGWGYGLPSFLCLLGTLLVVHELLERHVNDEAAAWSGLALVAMPTLVYQSASSKNDIPVLFAVACWALAIDRWRAGGGRRWCLALAVALGFGAGAKSSGLPIAGILGLSTLWILRRDRRALLCFVASCLPAILLLGSIETYVNNFRVYGEPLGPGWFVRQHRNVDGVRGATANFLRYALGNFNCGLEWLPPPPRPTTGSFTPSRRCSTDWGSATRAHISSTRSCSC